MLIGKNIRRVSHNLIISKYFEEENNEIQNQYFIRNVADELSVISLGFGGFFVVINPCSFAIEYSSETFKELLDINLVEVPKFAAKAATVFRIVDHQQLPIFDFDYIKAQLETDEDRHELEVAIEAISGINSQYSVEQGSLGVNFDSIELNVEALNAANYKHLESEEYKIVAIESEATELEVEIAKRKQELELLNQELANIEGEVQSISSENSDKPQVEDENKTNTESVPKEKEHANNKADVIIPEDLFAELEELLVAEEYEFNEDLKGSE